MAAIGTLNGNVKHGISNPLHLREMAAVVVRNKTLQFG